VSTVGTGETPVVPRDIERALEQVGVRDRPIVMHASLKALGHATGGPDTIVDATISMCSTVMVPAFCFEPNWAPPPDDRPAQNGCDYAFYDGWDRPRTPWVIETASIDATMGVVPRALARRAGTSRSDHPWHSWLAWGEDADALVNPHPWHRPTLPLERLSQAGGQVVLLGVGLKSCTAVHMAEENAGRQPFIRWMLDRNGDVRRIRVAGCSKGFDRLWPYCDDLFSETSVGSAQIKAAPLTPLVDRLAGVLREEPGLTICSPTCLRCRDAALGGPLP
jgi:aminoglycoside 3-N-acetyltransferase